jgi:hypothetical protein
MRLIEIGRGIGNLEKYSRRGKLYDVALLRHAPVSGQQRE